MEIHQLTEKRKDKRNKQADNKFDIRRDGILPRPVRDAVQERSNRSAGGPPCTYAEAKEKEEGRGKVLVQVQVLRTMRRV